MKILKRLILLRRQSDVVKVMVIVGMFTVWMIIRMIASGIAIYQMVHTSIEYEATADGETNVHRIQYLKDMKNVMMVGRQEVTERELKIGKDIIVLRCIGVEKQYAEQVYSISGAVNQNMIYVSEKDYDRFFSKKNQNIEYHEGEKSGQMSVRKRNIRIPQYYGEVSVNGIYLIDERDFSREEQNIRIQMKQIDTTGTDIQKIEEVGYAVQNKAEIENYYTKYKMEWLKFKYRSSIFLLLCGMNIGLFQYEKNRK